MTFTPFIPDAAQWTDYFMGQVHARRNGKTSKTSDSTASMGGGLSVNDQSTRLTTVGKMKSANGGNGPRNVKVTITSPAEAAVEQAESELHNIKEDQKGKTAIQRQPVKRKAPSKKKGKEKTKKKRKVSRKPQDIFSK